MLMIVPNTKLNKPLSAYYTGASGGCFFALSLALVTQDTHCISSTSPLHDIIKQNWNISDIDRWDEFQVRYDNNYNLRDGDPAEPTIHQMPDGRMPIIKYDNYDHIVNDGSTSTGIYTDVDTQWELMRLKHRYYFKEEIYNDTVQHPINAYNNVKDPSWPNITKIEDFDTLSAEIQDELINVFDFPEELTDLKNWFGDFKKNISFKFRGSYVIKQDNIFTLDKMDHVFLLQDIVKTKFKCVTDALELEHTQEVADHVDQWVALHPENIQALFYKDI